MSNKLIDKSNWHTVTITIPFPTTSNAILVKQVIEVDKPLRPSEITRVLTVLEENSSLLIEFSAITISQARVALDHCLSDLQLVVQTMAKFSPSTTTTTATTKLVKNIVVEEAKSLEVGLKGSWGSVAR